ncbi:transposase [Chloroflexota bacterium]
MTPIQKVRSCFPMAYANTNKIGNTTQDPPVVGELKSIFLIFPDDELLRRPKGPRRRGPHGYNLAILWQLYTAYYYLGLHSVSDLIRLLYDNRYMAKACRIDWLSGIPSQPTFSRFFTRPTKRGFRMTGE